MYMDVLKVYRRGLKTVVAGKNWKEKHRDVWRVKKANSSVIEYLHRMFVKRKAGQIPTYVGYCFVDNDRRGDM